MNDKDFYVKKVEPAKKVEKSKEKGVWANAVFAVASLVAAGVAFGGVGPVVGNTSLQYIAGLGFAMLTADNIKKMRSKLKAKTGKEEEKGISKGK